MSPSDLRIRELEEQLQLSEKRRQDLAADLHKLAAASLQLSTHLAVMCEAYLANDSVLALHQLGQLAARYEQFIKPAGRSIH